MLLRLLELGVIEDTLAMKRRKLIELRCDRDLPTRLTITLTPEIASS